MNLAIGLQRNGRLRDEQHLCVEAKECAEEQNVFEKTKGHGEIYKTLERPLHHLSPTFVRHFTNDFK